jgi:hypothetical protein
MTSLVHHNSLAQAETDCMKLVRSWKHDTKLETDLDGCQA